MGHHSCCNQQKVKRGLWSPEEDEKLIRYITTYGYGCWSEVPEKAELQRCGKSCRLRWINYLRPDIRRGRFTPEEEKLIINLHEAVGNRWAHIASHLPGRTDNEIKNYWNSWIKKKIRNPNSSNTSTTNNLNTLPFTNNQHSQFGHLFTNQDLEAKPQGMLQDTTLLSSPEPLFMFDTATCPFDGINDGNFHITTTTSSELMNSDTSWNVIINQQEVKSSDHHAVPSFAIAANCMDNSNYLPPLIENMEVQSNCNMNGEEETALMNCLKRQEMNEWVETQQPCSSYLFWEGEEAIGGDGINVPTSSDMGALLSSFSSSL